MTTSNHSVAADWRVCFVICRLKLNFLVLRSCVRWCTRVYRTRYVLRSGWGQQLLSRRNSDPKWATKSLWKPAPM